MSGVRVADLSRPLLGWVEDSLVRTGEVAASWPLAALGTLSHPVHEFASHCCLFTAEANPFIRRRRGLPRASIGSVFARLSSTVSNDDLRAEIEQILHGDNEFASDRDLRDDVVNELTANPDEVLSHCHNELDQLRRASVLLRSRVVLYAIVTSFTLTVAVLVSAKILSWYSTAGGTLIGIGTALGTLSLAIAIATVRRALARWRHRAYAKLQAIAAIQAQLRAAIRQSITALIGSERRWSNVVRPTDAPALVEVALLLLVPKGMRSGHRGQCLRLGCVVGSRLVPNVEGPNRGSAGG
jgi:hypothetical protein